MPQFQHHASWTENEEEGVAQVVDLETAVKDGILLGAAGGGVLFRPAPEKLDLKQMIEEIEESSGTDDIPAVFICPISLYPMLDPVTLCTGQTYDRPNIQKWLSMGGQYHPATCPTTMQELWEHAVTPNRTLRHLIHAWFSQRYLRIKNRSDDVGGQAADLLNSLRRVKGQARLQTLKELGNLVALHPAAVAAIKSLADAGGAALLSSLLGPFTSHAVGSEVVAILVRLHLDSSARANLMQPAKISLVVDMLNEGTVDTKINSARLIEILMEGRNFRSEMLSSPSLLVGLLRLVKDRRHPNGVAAGLGLLKAIICGDQKQKQQQVCGGLMVRVGAVDQLVELLPHLNPECLDPALHILHGLSSIPEARAALKDCPQTIPNMVKLLMRISESCTEHALSILWCVCKLAPDECAPKAVDAGLPAKLLLVIQSGSTPSLKQRSVELLKLCSLNYTATVFISKCKLSRTIQ